MWLLDHDLSHVCMSSSVNWLYNLIFLNCHCWRGGEKNEKGGRAGRRGLYYARNINSWLILKDFIPLTSMKMTRTNVHRWRTVFEDGVDPPSRSDRCTSPLCYFSVSKWTSIGPCGWLFTLESSVPCLNARRFISFSPTSTAEKTRLFVLYKKSIVLATWPPSPTMQRVTSCSRNRNKINQSMNPVRCSNN